MAVRYRASALLSMWLLLCLVLLLPVNVAGSTPTPNDNGLSAGDIVCIVIGTILGATLLCILVYLMAFGHARYGGDGMDSSAGSSFDHMEDRKSLIPAPQVPSQNRTVNALPQSINSRPEPSAPEPPALFTPPQRPIPSIQPQQTLPSSLPRTSPLPPPRTSPLPSPAAPPRASLPPAAPPRQSVPPRSQIPQVPPAVPPRNTAPQRVPTSGTALQMPQISVQQSHTWAIDPYIF